MIAKHLQTPPTPPSERTDLPVSPELERLIMKCLAKHPNERPQTAAALREALGWISADAWGEKQAEQWWAGNRSAIPPAPVSAPEYLTTVENPAPAF
jgi:serine/threonine-protein kinase